MKFQIELVIDVDTSLHEVSTKVSSVRTLQSEPVRDLLGSVPDKPKGRTGLDKDLTELINFFRLHPDRPSVYVPKWAKDKVMLRPYVQAKGVARVREMLDTFVKRSPSSLGMTDGNNFNGGFILEQPLTIQGFIAAADRLDQMIDWATEEVPYGSTAI